MFLDLRLAIFYFEMDYLQAYVTRVLLHSQPTNQYYAKGFIQDKISL